MSTTVRLLCESHGAEVMPVSLTRFNILSFPRGRAECIVTMFLAVNSVWNFASPLEVTDFLTGTVAGEADCLGFKITLS